MPRKKEVEEQIDVVQKERKETFATRWFKDYAVNNAREMKYCCDLTARSAEEQFSMYIKSGNTELYAVVYYVTFITILDFIKSKQKNRLYNDFTMEICNSINIGYTNSTNDDNEKVGNFMPVMEYISINRNIVDDTDVDDENRSQKNLNRWMVLNNKKNAEYYKDIQEKAYDTLAHDFHIRLRTSEAVIPLFCIFSDAITSVLKMKYKEAQGTNVSEVSMNVFGLYDIFYSYDEESDREIIEFSPNIAMKLKLKNDEIASGSK